MTPLRVLHVYKTYFPETQGGLEEVIRQICRSTRSLAVTNRVFTLASGIGEDCLDGQEAQVFRYRRNLEIASCGISLKAFQRFPEHAAWADVLHYHFPWPFADFLDRFLRPQRPSIVTYHSDVIRQKALKHVYRPLMKRFLAQASVVVATSPGYLQTSDVLSRYAARTAVVPIGIDEASYPQPGSAVVRLMRERVGEGFLLFVGVLRHYKGLEFLLEAAAGTTLPVVIAGEGPRSAELRRTAAAAGLDHVAFLGRVSDPEKIALLTLCRAVVLPSHLRSEAFGVSLLEGAMCGRALISTELGTGTTYVNRHGETGLVVPPADPKALRQAMTRMHADPELARRYGAAARARYQAMFTGAGMGRAYRALYGRALGGR